MNVIRFPAILFVIFCVALYCSPKESLTEAKKAKLDRHLSHLLNGEKVDESLFDVQKMTDGTKLYSVIIRSKNPEEIKKSGIVISSIFGDVIVARVTLLQLRTLIDLPSVLAIQTGTVNTPVPYH